MLMCESAVGVATTTTRQNAGTRSADAPRGVGGVNAPSVTRAADTTDTLAIRMSVNDAQSPAATTAGAGAAANARPIAITMAAGSPEATFSAIILEESSLRRLHDLVFRRAHDQVDGHA